MPEPLDPSFLRNAGQAPPRPAPASPRPAQPAPAPAPRTRSAAQPAAAPRPRARAARPPEKASRRPRETRSDAERLVSVGTLLTQDQVRWLYAVNGQAVGAMRQVSHSELVRLCIDRLRARCSPAEAARLATAAAPVGGHTTSYALAKDQISWMRSVRAQALMADVSVSQADVIRAAVEAEVAAGTTWRDLQAG